VLDHNRYHRPLVGSCWLCKPGTGTVPGRAELPAFYRAQIRNHEARVARLIARRYEIW
jgi:hypothetical protein